MIQWNPVVYRKTLSLSLDSFSLYACTYMGFQFSSTNISGLPSVCQPVEAGDSEIMKIQPLPFRSSQSSKVETQTNHFLYILHHSRCRSQGINYT